MKSSISIWTVVKFLLCCNSLLLVSQNTKACGPDFSGYYFTWLLEHYTYNNKFFNYQFDANNRFYSKSWNYEEETNSTTDLTKYNVDTWRNYLSIPKSIQDSDIKNAIYLHTTTINSFFDKHKNATQINEYLTLLNEYTTNFLPPTDAWDYSSYTNFSSLEKTNEFTKKCEQLMSKTNDSFLQWRILYLLLRATHFNKHHHEAKQLYDKYVTQLNPDNSLAQYWCEGMYAGILLRLHDDAQSIYYAARAFANCPDQYEAAMNTYLFSNRNWKSALPYCKNSEDSIYVALLEGANYTTPNMEFIQFVYKESPASEELKLLWLREMSKIDEFQLGHSDDFWGNGASSHYYDSLYKATNVLKDFLQLGTKILTDEKNIPVKVTVGNSLAYYYYEIKNYSKAMECLQKIAPLPKDEIETKQFELLQSLTELKQKNNFDEKNFIQLVNFFNSQKAGNFNAHVAHYLLYNEIAPYYLTQKKDTLTAFWMYAYDNSIQADSFDIYQSDYSPEGWNNVNYATYILNHVCTVAQINLLKETYISKKGTSDFENFVIKNTKIKQGIKLFDLGIARKYMLVGNWENAIALLDKLPTDYLSVKGPNPANFSINDSMVEDTLKNNFSVKQILTLAQKLKTNADKKEVTFAKDKLLYGTLLYNLSFYGKNHYVVDNHWNHYGSRNTAYYLYDSVDAHLFIHDNDIYQLPMNKIYQNYFYLYTAEKYLKEALPQLINQEDKAQCTFLLAKCWQKRCPLVYKKTSYGYNEVISDYVKYSLKNPYFAVLSRDLKQTKIQEQVFNSCSYYQQFLKK